MSFLKTQLTTMQKENKIVSPLTRNENIELIDKKNSQWIINEYKRLFDIDVSKYFNNHKEVSLYKCKDTDYHFFHPFQIAGDGDFYAHFQHYDWYYMPYKWEHKKASEFIKKNDLLLEIGAAKGDFLSRMQEKDIRIKGLELNKKAAEEAKKKGLDVICEDIVDHAENNIEKYDCIASFQVLEHISEVYPVIEAMIKCLKKGGTLIISVPNNNSYLKWDEKNILNMPPHHIGLWDSNSLKNLCNIFPLSLKDICYETLQPYQKGEFRRVVAQHYKKKNKIPFRVTHKLIPYSLPLFSKCFKGMTVIAVYEKL